MRRTLFALVLLIACNDRPTAPTPAPPVVPTPAPPATVVLRIQVVDAVDGTGVPRANLIVRRAGETTQFSEVTDDTGRIQFNEFQTGVVILRALKTAYDVTEREVTVTTDTTVTLELAPRRFTVSGRVTDVTSGTPLSGAALTILDGDNAGRTTMSASDGTYSMSNVWFGGFTMRARQAGYDSVFRGVRLVENTSVDFAMRREQQTLAGTWTGSAVLSDGSRFSFAEVTITQSGTTVANAPGEFAYSFFAFTGALDDPSRLGSSSQLAGTLRWTTTVGNPRLGMTCTGTGRFSGTASWTDLRIGAERVTYDCPNLQPVGVTLTLIKQR